EYQYDELNRLVKLLQPKTTTTDSSGTPSSTPTSPVTQFAYDAAGNRTVVTDPNGNATVSKYNQQNQLIQITAPDPDGAGPLHAPLTFFTYDAAGNQTETRQMIDVDGPVVPRKTITKYDKLNRPYWQTDPQDNYVVTTYNVDGTVHSTRPFSKLPTPTSTTSTPLAAATVYGYDELGRKASVAVPTTGTNTDTTAYAYDRVGNVRKQTDPANNVTKLSYDHVYRLIGEETNIGTTASPTPVTRAYGYDAAGDLISKTDRNGHEIDYDYDALGRRIGETWVGSDGNGYQADYHYDLLGNLLGAKDGNMDHEVLTDLVFGLDELYRQNSVSEKLTGFAPESTPTLYDSILTYGYDAAGNRTKTAASVNSTADFQNLYGFDHLNRVTSIEQTGASGAGVNAKTVKYEYEGDGQIDKIKRYNSTLGSIGNGNLVASSNYDYNENGQLKELGHLFVDDPEPKVHYAWTYYDDGQLETLHITRGSLDSAGQFATHQTFAYDDSGQATSDGQSTTQYDANGNRNTGGYTTVRDNRLTEDLNFTYEYDAEGNRTLRTLKSYDRIFDANTTPNTNGVSIIKAGFLETDFANGYGGSQSVGLTSSGNGATWTISNLTPGTYDIYATWKEITSGSTTAQFVSRTAYLPSEQWVQTAANFQYAPADNLHDGSGTAWKLIAGELHVNEDNTIVVNLDGGYVVVDAIRIIRHSASFSATRYVYDYANRLTSAINYSNTGATNVVSRVDYFYDALGRRVSSTRDNGNSTYYVLDGQQVVHEFNTIDELQGQRVLWGVQGQIVAFEDRVGGSTLSPAWTLTDEAGSVRDLVGRRSTDDHSYIFQTELFNSFGNALGAAKPWDVPSGVAFSTHLHYYFAGQQWDATSRLSFGPGAVYDSVAGQFISQNHHNGDTNPYRRGGNAPNRVGNTAVSPWSSGAADDGLHWWQVVLGVDHVLRSVMGASRDAMNWVGARFYDASVYIGDRADNSSYSALQFAGHGLAMGSASASGAYRGAAGILGASDVLTFAEGIQENYKKYDQLGVGFGDATMLMFNPATGLWEAGYGESYQTHDFGKKLDSLDRWGRGIQSAVNTVGMAAGITAAGQSLLRFAQAGFGAAAEVEANAARNVGEFGGCFFGGTLIDVEGVRKPIEEVYKDGRVGSFDLVSGQWRLCRVVETYENEYVGEQVNITVAGETIASTVHHPYWVISGKDLLDRPRPEHIASAEVPNSAVSGRWIDAGDLQVGDVLLSQRADYVSVDAIERRQVAEKVYNFQVEELHNYTVGNHGILVHNNAPCSRVATKAAALQDMAAESSAARSSLLDRYLSESGGRWGGTRTRALNNQLAIEFLDQEFTIAGGAGRAAEEYIAGAGPGTRGATFVDITATNGTRTIRVQTINTLADGVTPTPGEAAAAARIRAAFPNDELRLIPKR
ncbi:MAG: hypothetical protein K8T25_17745, partial [Planctomycetia bacterium]|nr:hypothetical protein [Planctomycetia bacterium]